MKILLLCVGNELMLDDGIGIEVFRQMRDSYEFPNSLDLCSAGCMTMDMIGKVNEYDLIITVDAIEGTGEKPGTIFRYTPDDAARRGTPMGSLHELKLADLFDAAAFLGYRSKGVCFGMQVDNASPSEFAIGLTSEVEKRLPFLIDAVLAELVHSGCDIRVRTTGELVCPGYHHSLISGGAE